MDDDVIPGARLRRGERRRAEHDDGDEDDRGPHGAPHLTVG